MRVLPEDWYERSEPHAGKESSRAGDRVIAGAASTLTVCAEWTSADVIRPGVRIGHEVRRRTGRSMRSANRGPRAPRLDEPGATRGEPRSGERDRIVSRRSSRSVCLVSLLGGEARVDVLASDVSGQRGHV